MNKSLYITSLLAQYKALDIENAVDFKKFNQYLVSHHSTSIEGSTLTYIETTVLLEQGLTPKGKPLVHTLMQKDHYEALVFTIENAKNAIYTPDFIQKINSKVLRTTGHPGHVGCAARLAGSVSQAVHCTRATDNQKSRGSPPRYRPLSGRDSHAPAFVHRWRQLHLCDGNAEYGSPHPTP